MPANLLLYPNTYPAESNEDSELFAVENAVTTLQLQARDTAVRQSHTRRIGGQNDIENQNKLCSSQNILMPLDTVGEKVVPVQTLQGTVAYLIGGRTHQGVLNRSLAFYYSNESIVPTGVRSSDIRMYQGSFNAPENGYLCGGLAGITLSSAVVRTIDEFSYHKPSIQRIGAQLSQARRGCAGVGVKTKGAVFGGGTVPRSGAAVRTGDLFTYATKTNQGLGNKLTTERYAPHNGTSSKTNGFIYGGAARGWWQGTPLRFSIDSYNFTNDGAGVIAGATINAHVVHAAFGSTIKGYVAGGWNQEAQANPWSNVITAFTYSGQTVAVLANTLTEPKICPDGANSSLAGYIMGGDTTNSNWQGTDTIDKLVFASETRSRLGSKLGQKMADQGVVSDFSPSW